jgi:hypothetical protein
MWSGTAALTTTESSEMPAEMRSESYEFQTPKVSSEILYSIPNRSNLARKGCTPNGIIVERDGCT